MISPNKTFRRLGIVGAAAVVGLVPATIMGGPADAATNASLALASTTPGATTTATNGFTATNSAGASTVTITSNLANPGTTGTTTNTAETLPQQCTGGTASAPTPTGCGTYTVTYTTPTSSTTTTDTVTGVVLTDSTGATIATTSPGTPGDTAALTLAQPIPNNANVTVTITNVTNGTNGSQVYFTDNDGAGASNSNSITLAYTPVSTPGVTSINPTAYNANGSEPFTITGTNFQPGSGTNGANPSTGTQDAPVVCFVEAGTTVPPTNTAGTNPCVDNSVAASGSTPAQPATVSPATVTGVAPGEIQGNSPSDLAPDKTYNVVVYNYDPHLNGTGGYTAASGTTSQTVVGTASNLNFVPEAGVRVIDSRTGLTVPKGVLTTGKPISVPLSAFRQTLTLPTNLPSNYAGLDVNVTAVAPASGGNIQMWTEPSGTSCPNGLTSPIKPATVNFQPPQDTNNSQLVAVAGGADTGTLCIQNNGAAVNLVVDVVGYATDYTTPSSSTQTRVLDTRPSSQMGSIQGPLQSNTVYRVNTGITCYTNLGSVGANGPCSTNNGVTGTLIAFNVAAVAPSAPGNLRVFPEPSSGAPSPADVPNTAVDNYIVNTDSSAMIITMVPPSGYIDLYSAMAGAGTMNAVIDILGGLDANSSVHPVSQPYRIYDSRPGPIPAAGTVTVTGAPTGSGSEFTPASALGLVGNLSDINPVGQGYLVTFPAGGVVPGTASIANFPLQTRNTNNIVALNPSNGSFSIYAGGAATNTTYDDSAFIGDGGTGSSQQIFF